MRRCHLYNGANVFLSVPSQRRSLNQSSRRRSHLCGPDWTRRSSGLGTRKGGSGWVRGYCGAAAHLGRRDPPQDRRSKTQRGSPWCWRTTTGKAKCLLDRSSPGAREDGGFHHDPSDQSVSCGLYWWLDVFYTTLQLWLHLLSRTHQDKRCNKPQVRVKISSIFLLQWAAFLISSASSPSAHLRWRWRTESTIPPRSIHPHYQSFPEQDFKFPPALGLFSVAHTVLWLHR